MGIYTSYKRDKNFLKALNREKLQTHYVKIEVLDLQENPITSIEGKCAQGASINIDGSSSMRRTCNISFIADEGENDLTNVNNILSINKRIAIYEGIENDIDTDYPEVIWLKQGVFVINQVSISHSTSSYTISLSCKDKMCLLNGECGGGLPASITFDSYDQILEDGSTISIPQRIYDIIFSIVHRYGNISMDKIFVSDIELEIKQSVRYTGSKTLYFNSKTSRYTYDASLVEAEPPESVDNWKVFGYNDDVGYVYTDFVYPGELVSGIGETVCGILDKIKAVLGNYEYFFDVDGNFHFQEIKNYLNNSYDPTNAYRLDAYNQTAEVIRENGLCILDKTNYSLDKKSNSKNEYEFTTGDLLTSCSYSPNYANIKNDFHIWGATDKGQAIHYHLAIKEKPKVMNTYAVCYIPNSTRIRLATDAEIEAAGLYGVQGTVVNIDPEIASFSDETLTITMASASYDATTETETLPYSLITTEYVPNDWRAELYLRGLEKQKNGIRPDVFEQELLDLFDNIYDFQTQKFKADLVRHPNDLMYFFDYLEPINNLYDYSVDTIGLKTISVQQDKIKRLYNVDFPDVIVIDNTETQEEKDRIRLRCEREGQSFSNVDHDIYKNFSIGTIGYTAEEVARDNLYRYTNYNETINLNSIPIYHIEPNTRITVRDYISGVDGDYVIKSISLPLGGTGTMTISATKALDRI